MLDPKQISLEDKPADLVRALTRHRDTLAEYSEHAERVRSAICAHLATYLAGNPKKDKTRNALLIRLAEVAGKDMDWIHENFATVGQGVVCRGDLEIGDIDQIPHRLTILGNLLGSRSKLRTIPFGLFVEGDAILDGSEDLAQITHRTNISDERTFTYVGGELSVRDCPSLKHSFKGDLIVNGPVHVSDYERNSLFLDALDRYATAGQIEQVYRHPVRHSTV